MRSLALTSSSSKKIFSIILSLTALFLVVYLFVCSIPVLLDSIHNSKKEKFEIVDSELLSNDLIGDYTNQNSLSQSFKTGGGTFNSVGVKLATYMNKNLSCNLYLSVFENGFQIRSAHRSCEEIRDNQFFTFTFEPVEGSENTNFSFSLDNDGSGLNRIAIYTNNSSNRTFSLNTLSREGSITYIVGSSTQTSINTEQIKYFLYLSILILVVFGIIWLLLHKHKYWLTVFSIVSIGSIFIFTVPPFQNLDEHEHFLRSVELSYGDFSSAKFGSFQTAPEYPDVINLTLWLEDDVSGGSLNEILNVLSKKAGNIRFVKSATTAAAYFPTAHLPFAITIFGGRLLNFPVIFQLYLARTVSLSFLIIFVIFAIKISPKYYLLWISLGLIPTVLSQASAVSVDTLVTGSVVILTSILVSKTRLAMNTLLFVIVVSMSLAFSKIVYFPLSIAMLFSAMSRNYSFKKSSLLTFVLSIIILISIYFWFAYLGMGQISKDERLPDSNPSVQIAFITSQPLKYTILIVQSFSLNFLYYLESSSQYVNNNYRLGTSPIQNFSFLTLTVCLLIVALNSTFTIRRFNYLLGLICLFISIFLVFTAMFVAAATPGKASVYIQPRYLSLLWPLIIILLAFPFRFLPKYFYNYVANYYALAIYLSTLIIAIGTYIQFAPIQ